MLTTVDQPAQIFTQLNVGDGPIQRNSSKTSYRRTMKTTVAARTTDLTRPGAFQTSQSFRHPVTFQDACLECVEIL